MIEEYEFLYHSNYEEQNINELVVSVQQAYDPSNKNLANAFQEVQFFQKFDSGLKLLLQQREDFLLKIQSKKSLLVAQAKSALQQNYGYIRQFLDSLLQDDSFAKLLQRKSKESGQFIRVALIYAKRKSSMFSAIIHNIQKYGGDWQQIDQLCNELIRQDLKVNEMKCDLQQLQNQLNLLGKEKISLINNSSRSNSPTNFHSNIFSSRGHIDTHTGPEKALSRACSAGDLGRDLRCMAQKMKEIEMKRIKNLEYVERELKIELVCQEVKIRETEETIQSYFEALEDYLSSSMKSTSRNSRLQQCLTMDAKSIRDSINLQNPQGNPDTCKKSLEIRAESLQGMIENLRGRDAQPAANAYYFKKQASKAAGHGTKSACSHHATAIINGSTRSNQADVSNSNSNASCASNYFSCAQNSCAPANTIAHNNNSCFSSSRNSNASSAICGGSNLGDNASVSHGSGTEGARSIHKCSSSYLYKEKFHRHDADVKVSYKLRNISSILNLVAASNSNVDTLSDQNPISDTMNNAESTGPVINIIDQYQMDSSQQQIIENHQSEPSQPMYACEDQRRAASPDAALVPDETPGAHLRKSKSLQADGNKELSLLSQSAIRRNVFNSISSKTNTQHLTSISEKKQESDLKSNSKPATQENLAAVNGTPILGSNPLQAEGVSQLAPREGHQQDKHSQREGCAVTIHPFSQGNTPKFHRQAKGSENRLVLNNQGQPLLGIIQIDITPVKLTDATQVKIKSKNKENHNPNDEDKLPGKARAHSVLKLARPEQDKSTQTGPLQELSSNASG